MYKLKFIYSTVIAFAEVMAVYFLGKDFIQIRKVTKVLFWMLFVGYEIFNMANNLIDFGTDDMKLLFLIFISISFIIGNRSRNVWNLVYFFCNLLILRSTCQLFKLFFLTIYSGVEMDLVMKNLNEFSLTMAIFYFLFYIPGFIFTKYLWRQLTLCKEMLLHISSLMMLLLLVTMEFVNEWEQILITMPSLILLLVVVSVWRAEAEKKDNRKLQHYKELEYQMKEMDRELEEIRKEVEKYYQRAGEKSTDYAEQILKKIEKAKGE